MNIAQDPAFWPYASKYHSKMAKKATCRIYRSSLVLLFGPLPRQLKSLADAVRFGLETKTNINLLAAYSSLHKRMRFFT